MVKLLLLGWHVDDPREREPSHNGALQKAALQLQAIKYQDLEMHGHAETVRILLKHGFNPAETSDYQVVYQEAFYEKRDLYINPVDAQSRAYVTSIP